MKRWILWTFPLLLSCATQESPDAFPELRGDYLGQVPPGDEPEIFAPGILSTGLYTRDIAMTPEGDAKKILKKAGNAIFTDADDVEGIKATLVLAYKEFKEGRLKRTPDEKYIATFEKPKLVEKLASVLDGLLH